MLTVNGAQLDAMSRQDQERFVEFLYEDLLPEFPELFLSLPRSVACRMLRRGVERARAQGFVEAGGIAAFIRLMALIGADFDEHPMVADVLAGIAEADETKRLSALVDGLSEADLEEAYEDADDRAWFAPDDTAGWTVATVCWSFSELSAVRPEDRLYTLAAAAVEKAGKLGLEDNDAVPIIAACIAFYGDDFDGPSGPPWCRDVLPRPDLPSAVRLELLRVRIALDTGRMI